MNLGSRHGCGRVGAHSARVRSFVPVLQPLVILRSRQRQNIPAICHDDEAQFLARQKLLDDYFTSRRAELPVEHRSHDRNGFVRRLRDDHALARRQAARLYHDGDALPAHILRIEILTRERRVAGRWNPVPAQKFLRVGLRAFQLCGPAAGTEASQALGTEGIDDPGHQRGLGADDRQTNPFCLRQRDQRGEVFGAGVYVSNLALRGRARIAGGDEDFGDPGGFGALPRQGVFAAAGADNQNLHVSAGNDACR